MNGLFFRGMSNPAAREVATPAYRPPLNQPVSLPEAARGIIGPATDEVHFGGGKKRKQPPPSESLSGSDAPYEPESSDPTTETAESSEVVSPERSSDRSSQHEEPTPPPRKRGGRKPNPPEAAPRRYPLRERQPINYAERGQGAPPAPEASDENRSEGLPLRRQGNRKAGPPAALDLPAELANAIQANVWRRLGEGAETNIDLAKKMPIVAHGKSLFNDGQCLGLNRVAGRSELKAQLQTLLLNPLQHPAVYQSLGMNRLPKGALLYGPPGCGKTFIAKAFAEEAGANFLPLSAVALAAADSGSVGENILDTLARALKQAKKTQKPTVLFLDHLDHLASRRGADESPTEETSALLSMMDAVDGRSVFVLGASHLPERIDPTLIGDQHFPHKIYIGGPDAESRTALVKNYLAKAAQEGHLAPDFDFERVAREMPEFSTAQVRAGIDDGLKAFGTEMIRLPREQWRQLTAADFIPALKKMTGSAGAKVAHEYRLRMEKGSQESFSFPITAHDQALLPAAPGLDRDIRGFQRIRGMKDLKAEVEKLFLTPLQNPELARAYGLNQGANGLLLYGPPGCGKTYFAKVLAEEANANFMELPSSVFGSKYIHETAQKIAAAFNAARNQSKFSGKPTLIFLDEMESVAPERNEGVNNNNEEIAELLRQMNGLAKDNVFVVGATNLPHLLDPAVIRAGRLDGHVYVGAPDETSRQQLLELFFQDVRASGKLDEAVDLARMARRTANFSIADLEAVAQKIKMTALKRSLSFREEERPKISQADVDTVLKTAHPSIPPSTEGHYRRMIAQSAPQLQEPPFGMYT